jgi:hypothetical protein
MKMKFFHFLLLQFVWVVATYGQATAELALSAPILKEVQGKTLVTLQVQNTMSSAITGARAWVFLMDAKGKVLGNQAQWVITEEAKNSLPTGETREFTVAVAATGATQAKVIFPRIVLADGSTRVIKTPEGQ